MPVYEYKCGSCGRVVEAVQKISDKPLSACIHCGGLLSKLISNTSFVLKGSGWYADGYAAKPSAKTDKPTDTPSTSTAAK